MRWDLAQIRAKRMASKGYFLVCVCGSREHNFQWSDMSRALNDVVAELNKKGIHKVALVVGEARGIDTWAYRWARLEKVPRIRFDAPWSDLGKGAGFFRNNLMLGVAKKHISFWDGKSPGTLHCIDGARSRKIPRRVYQKCSNILCWSST